MYITYMGNALIVRSSNTMTRTTWPWRCGAFVKPLALAVILVLLDGPAQAETWKCPHPKYGTIYQDHPGEHCERAKLKPLGEMDREHLYMDPETAPAQWGVPFNDEGKPVAPPSPRRGLVNTPIQATRTIPVLMVTFTTARDPHYGSAHHGDGALVEITVSHLPSGKGPRVWADHNFKGSADASLGTAVLAAARATRYDHRFLNVELTMPMSWLGRLANLGFRLDGPSAGVAFAVAITSAILGDGLPTGVCLSGTISGSGSVGPVGGLTDKIDGCRYVGGTKLIVPAGQDDLDMEQKRSNLNIQLATAASLDEAYRLVVGRPIRELPTE